MYDYLVPFSFAWMVVAALLGLRLGVASIKYARRIDDIANSGDLAAYHAESKAFLWQKTVHAHTFLFSVVGAVIFFTLGHHVTATSLKDLIAGAVMVAAVLWPMAALRESRPLMGVADILFLLAIAACGASLFLPSDMRWWGAG